MKKRYYLPILSLVLFFAFLPQASAQYHFGKVTGEQVNPRISDAYSIAKQGNYAFVTGSSSQALAILDISDPNNPVPISNISHGENGAVLNNPIYVEVSGHYVFLANQLPDNVEIIDISDISNPVHVSNLVTGTGGITIGLPWDIDVVGNYAYVACSGGLEIIDISNPLAPVFAGRYSDAFQYKEGAISGNYYYANVGNTTIKVLDISNTSAPTLVDSYTFATGATNTTTPLRSITVAGNYAYATGDAYLEIIDISDPANLSFVGGYNNSNFSWETQVSGNTAYLGGTELIALDISNKVNPSVLDSHSGFIGHFELSGNYIVSAAANLAVLDVSNPSSITGKILYTPCAGLAISGNYAYLTKSYNALEIVDINQPAFPKTVGSIKHGEGGASLNWPVSVAVYGNYALVTSANANTIEIIDISNPAAPVHAASISDGQGGAKLKRPMSLAIKGNYAFVASTESDALEIIDISNPAAPVHAASVTNGDQGSTFEDADAITIDGNKAYLVGTDSDYLAVFDITDPLNPSYLGADYTGPSFSVAVSGTNAFTNNGYSIDLTDVSSTPAWFGGILADDPGNEIYLASNRLGPNSLYVSGNYLFSLGQGYDALCIFDISDLYNPVLVKALIHDFDGSLLDGPVAINVVGDYIYVTSHLSNSLEVIYFNPNFPDEPAVTFSDIYKTYGDADFNLSATSSNSSGTITYGIVEGTGATVASNGAASIVAADTVQVYAQIATNGTYGPKAVSANLFIAPKGITVTVDAGQSKALAAADPTFTYTVNPALVSGDAFSGALSRNSGETAGSYTITQGTLSAGSNYTITFSGNTFCINPDKPTITADGQDANILISSSSTGNQWYKDNSILNGATNNTYTVTTSGDYTVVNTVQGCSSVSSDAVTRTISELENAMTENMALYPNPASSSLVVELSEASGTVQITIYDATGRSAMSTESNLKRSTLNLDNLEPGVYWLRLQQENKMVVKQFVKN